VTVTDSTDLTARRAAREKTRVAPDYARSWLLLSAMRTDAFDDAQLSRADQILLDCEDAIDDSLKDEARSRAWLLTDSGVVVVDFKRQTRTHVPLPGWTWAGRSYACAPDLALGPKGEALVSSNVVPVGLRLDPHTQGVNRHQQALACHRGQDVGFNGSV
jgi:hypothetical protein